MCGKIYLVFIIISYLAKIKETRLSECFLKTVFIGRQDRKCDVMTEPLLYPYPQIPSFMVTLKHTNTTAYIYIVNGIPHKRFPDIKSEVIF